MKKGILALFIFLVIWVNTSFAAYYNNHTFTYSNPGGTSLTPISGGWPNLGTFCDDDGDGDGTNNKLAENNLAATLVPNGDSDIIVPVSGTMNCLYWDPTAPTDTTEYSNTGWTNGNVEVTITCSDTGGSGCDMYDIAGWTKHVVNKTYKQTFVSNTSGSINLRDVAWNTHNVPYSIANIDKTAPVFGDISWLWQSLAGTDMEPVSSKEFSISVDAAGGSAIASIQWYFENISVDLTPWEVATSWDSLTSTSSTLLVNRDISVVNENDSREYSFHIAQICDSVGNCGNNLATFSYNVVSSIPTAVENPFTGSIILWEYTALVKWNYNGRFLKVRDGWKDKIYAISSILLTNTWDLDLSTDDYNVSVDKYGDLPAAYSHLWYWSGGTYFPNNNILIYDIDTKRTYNDSELNIIANKIKSLYEWSFLANDDSYDDLFGDTNVLKESLELYLNGSVGSDTETPTYEWKWLDSNCSESDIVIGSQTWAPCNSTLWTVTAFSTTSNSCYDYAWNIVTCTATAASNTENNFIVGKSNNIWWSFYAHANIDSACPSGWRVPTDEDFQTLENNLTCSNSSSLGWRCDGLWWKWDQTIFNNLINTLKLPLWGHLDNSDVLKERWYTATYWTSTINGWDSQNIVREFYYNNSTENRAYKTRDKSFNIRCIKE